MIPSTSMRDVVLTPPSLVALRHVCRHMRKSDAAEIYPLRQTDRWEDLATDHWRLFSAGGMLFMKMLTDGFSPIGVLMILYAGTPRTAVAGFWATDDWPLIAHAATRLIKRRIIPDLMRAGLIRVEVRAAADNAASGAWLEHLGAQFETDLPCLGKHGETYRQYAWTQAPAAIKETRPCV